MKGKIGKHFFYVKKDEIVSSACTFSEVLLDDVLELKPINKLQQISPCSVLALLTHAAP